MKTVKITSDSVAKIIDFPENLKAMREEIGADLVERVHTQLMVFALGPKISFICDEEFWCKYAKEDVPNHLNAPASMLYNGVIMGDIFFIKEEGPDWFGFDSVELMELVLRLKDMFGEYLKWEDRENE